MQKLNHSWEQDTPNMFGSTKDGMGFSNIATAGISMFPRKWVVAMAENWMDDPTKGFYSDTPLTRWRCYASDVACVVVVVVVIVVLLVGGQRDVWWRMVCGLLRVQCRFPHESPRDAIRCHVRTRQHRTAHWDHLDYTALNQRKCHCHCHVSHHAPRRMALKDWAAHDPGVFAVVPDANWFMIRALYLHQVDRLANKFTLNHLKKYNMEWGGIPVAPEGRDTKFELFGDQYSNFNSGKILLLLEGTGGLKYSVADDSFTFADNLPTNWTFMEFRVPVVKQAGAAVTWVTARAERQCQGGRVTKTVTIDSNPFTRLVVRPWAEEKRVVSTTPAGATTNATVGHVAWNFTGSSTARVVLTLEGAC